MSTLMLIALAVAAFFWVLLPAGVLVAVFFVPQDMPEPGLHYPCRAADLDDLTVEPCWAPAGADYCPRHAHLGQQPLQA